MSDAIAKLSKKSNKLFQIKWLRASLLIFTAYTFLELFSLIAFFVYHQHLFSFQNIIAKRNLILDNVQVSGDLEVIGLNVPYNVPIHPFYGFGNPSGFKFLKEKNDEVQNDSNGVIVAITGGSVAYNLFNESKEVLKDYLKKVPQFKDKNIHIILLGYFAWKQPQQVTALAYYLAMGGKLDLLINLDGHNEIVDVEFNFDKKVFPAYPWLWYHLASNVVPSEKVRLIGGITNLRNLRHHVAIFFSHFPFVITMNVLWGFTDNLIETRINLQSNILYDFEKKNIESRPFYRFGPAREFGSRKENFEYSSYIWEKSSVQLHRIAKSSQVEYFHFLQPNQYVPDSKVLTKEEKKVAYDPNRKHVTFGYPYLLKAIPRLVNEGVKFHSLIYLFKDVQETVYSDKCCHFNRFGNDLISKEMGHLILQYYEKKHIKG